MQSNSADCNEELKRRSALEEGRKNINGELTTVFQIVVVYWGQAGLVED